MIINLSNFGGGGGGGSYVLPIASESTLGGVKIGSGVNIDSAGTISVQGGEQDYQIVTAITDFSAGKMYGVIENNYSASFVGNPSNSITCGNENTHIYGEVENIFDKYEFNPWLGKSNGIIDIYVTKETTDDYPTLNVLYGNDNVVSETLSYNVGEAGDETFDLPSSGDFSGVTLTVSFSDENNSITIDLDGPSLYENNGYIPTNLTNFNTNIFNVSGSTTGTNSVLKSIEYADGVTANPITMIESSRYAAVQGGSDDMHKQLYIRKMQGYVSIPQNEGSVNKDVLALDGQLWKYSTSSGTSCVINNYKGNNSYGDIVINYYNLPQNQILFDFYLEGWGSHRYVSYNNGVFTLWEDDQMTTSAETITEGTSFVFWSENVFGQAGKGVLSLTSTENTNGNINLIVSILGTWNEQDAGHWEPGDWNEQVSNAVLYKNNMMKSSIFAQVGLGGIVPTQLAQTDSLIDRFFGVVSMESVPAVFQTDSSGFTCNISYLPPNNMDNIRLVNVYLGAYQIEFNFYQDGVMFENKDTDGDWQIVSSGIIHSNTSATTWDSGESYEMTSTFQNNILSVHYTTDVGFDVQNLPVACLKFNDAYNPVRLR